LLRLDHVMFPCTPSTYSASAAVSTSFNYYCRVHGSLLPCAQTVPLLKWNSLFVSLFFFGARACNLPVQISTVRPFHLSAAGFIFCRFVLQNTFADYTARTSFERPLLSGVAYAQRVVHGDRESFERQQGWIIKTMKHEPSPVQDEYAPVVYSQETVSYIEGLDMMSGEVCGQVSCSFLALGYSFFFLLCGCWF
jgi:hypothetical protein